MQSAAERRNARAERVLFQGDIALRNPYNPDQIIHGRGVNLSAGGVSLRPGSMTSSPGASMQIGSQWKCQIDVGLDDQPVEAKVEVVWVQSHATESMVGLRFLELHLDDAAVLDHLVDKLKGRPSSQDPGSVEIHIQGASAPITATVRDSHLSTLVAEQPLGFLKIGDKVTLSTSGEEPAEAIIQNVELELDQTTPKLVMTFAHPEVDTHLGRERQADETWRDFRIFDSGLPAVSTSVRPKPNLDIIRSRDVIDLSEVRKTVSLRPESADETPAETESFDLKDAAPASHHFVQASDEFEFTPNQKEPTASSFQSKQNAERIARQLALNFGAARERSAVAASQAWRSLRLAWTDIKPVLAQIAEPINAMLRRLYFFMLRMVGLTPAQIGQRQVRQQRIVTGPSNYRAQGARHMPETEAKAGRPVLLFAAGLATTLLVFALYGVFGSSKSTDASSDNPSQTLQPNTPAAMPTMPNMHSVDPALDPSSQPQAAPIDAPADGANMPSEDDFYGGSAGSAGSVSENLERALPEPNYGEGRLPEPEYPSAPEFSATQRATTPARPNKLDTRIQPSPTTRGEATRTGSRSFGAANVKSGRTFLIRMSQPIDGVIGRTTTNGFHVIVPGSLALDKAKPIASTHPAVSQATIINRGDHAELTIQFAHGRTPSYRVSGRGSMLEIIIGN